MLTPDSAKYKRVCASLRGDVLRLDDMLSTIWYQNQSHYHLNAQIDHFIHCTSQFLVFM